jgi:hypothetical protein
MRTSTNVHLRHDTDAAVLMDPARTAFAVARRR